MRHCRSNPNYRLFLLYLRQPMHSTGSTAAGAGSTDCHVVLRLLFEEHAVTTSLSPYYQFPSAVAFCLPLSPHPWHCRFLHEGSSSQSPPSTTRRMTSQNSGQSEATAGTPEAPILQQSLPLCHHPIYDLILTPTCANLPPIPKIVSGSFVRSSLVASTLSLLPPNDLATMAGMFGKVFAKLSIRSGFPHL